MSPREEKRWLAVNAEARLAAARTILSAAVRDLCVLADLRSQDSGPLAKTTSEAEWTRDLAREALRNAEEAKARLSDKIHPRG